MQVNNDPILNLSINKRVWNEINAGTCKGMVKSASAYWNNRFFNADGSAKPFSYVQLANGHARKAPLLIAEWKGIQKTSSFYIILIGKVMVKPLDNASESDIKQPKKQ